MAAVLVDNFGIIEKLLPMGGREEGSYVMREV
jgi:hypothetical protein